MGLNLKNWLIKNILRRDPGDNTGNAYVSVADILKDQSVQDAIYEVYLRELAFWTCVNKIANAILSLIHI